MKPPTDTVVAQLYLPFAPFFRRFVVQGRRVAVDPALHHLAKVNGVWCVRLTIDRGSKLVGQRIKVSLGTGDVGIAMGKRDAILRAYREAGVKVLTTGEAKQKKHN